MWETNKCDCRFSTYEEEYKGFEVYIEREPDPYGEGYVWSVCKDNEELACEVNFVLEMCIKDAEQFIDKQDFSIHY